MPHYAGSLIATGMKKKKEIRIINTAPTRLAWTRQALVLATGLCQRSIQNLEYRGILKRIDAGVKTALYSDASVQAWLGTKAAQSAAQPSTLEAA